MPRFTNRYNVFGLYSSASPSTGFQFQTGFNNAYTGANSGFNLIQGLQRVQSVTDSFSVDRQLVNQLGQLSYVSQELTSAPSVPLSFNWIVADASNEAKIGLYVSGDQGALKNILLMTQNERNMFIGVAPEGVDAVGYTGQLSVFQLNNCYFDSYTTQASVGGFATASATMAGLNYSTSTG